MSSTKQEGPKVETQIKFGHLPEQGEEEEVPKKPSNFASVLGILLTLTIFCFTFTVVCMYMMCKLPNQVGKLCYFEQYRTILNETIS